MSAPLRIGTRGSRLALWQAEHIAARLRELGHPCELRIITTKGDRIQDLSFDKLEGKGFFTKELEEALLRKDIDLAVHSCKDLETTGPEGLAITAIAGRAACEELLIVRPDAEDIGLPLFVQRAARVGTSSARRKAQLKAFRPDVRIQDLRGNVPTRVDKLRNGEHDAILLARAGIDRLGFDLRDLRVHVLDPRWFVPAPAQGALAVQTRDDDDRVNIAVRKLHEEDTALLVECERAVLRSYRGGCQVPLGVHVTRSEQGISLWAAAARQADATPRWVHLRGMDPQELSAEAVARLDRPVQPLRVTITRKVDEDALIARVLRDHGIALQDLALMEARAVPFTPSTRHERIFFTSRNAVRFFVQGGGDLQAVPCDAIGAGTAEELRRHGIRSAFVGEGPDSGDIALRYAEEFQHQRILFPIAAGGLRTVQRALPLAQVIEMEVYAMHPVDAADVPATDVAILTSPEHAALFHAKCDLSTILHVIAMGTSTAERIDALAGRAAILPWASNEMALLQAVLRVATEPLS